MAVKKKKNDLSPKKKTILSVVFGILCVCLVTGIVVMGYVVSNLVIKANGDKIINLDDEKNNQSKTTIVYAYDEDRNPVELTRLHGEENRIWVDLNEMPKCLMESFVNLEDKRFYDHHGVDWVRLGGVITKMSFSQGGSTITQQLIKNLTGENQVWVVRKYNEIITALNLEKHYTKETILEAYLNTLYLGSGCYGVKTAAETYFGKDVSELNLAESACLAVITKAPYKYNPLYNPENNKNRQEHCLKIMLEEGVISQAEYDEAVNYQLVFTNSANYQGSTVKHEDKKEDTNKEQSFYIDYVIDTVISDLMKQYDLTKKQATNRIYYGGLKIYCAVDSKVQKELEDVYTNRVTFKEKSTDKNPAAQSAMTIMDYKGRVVAIVGQAGKKDGPRCLNRAAASPRQPGSTIKPLACYAPAIEKNIVNWSSMILDKAFPYQGTMYPQNSDGKKGSGQNISVQVAIQKSLNTVPARLIYNEIGIENSYSFLADNFGFHYLNKQNDSALAPMATGGMYLGFTSVELASAYAMFGNGGKYYAPYCYYQVTSSDGDEIILSHNDKDEGKQVISEETADIMCELLQTVDTTPYGSGSSVRKFQIMAKTGTTSDNKDRWFAAGTPHYVAAVWYGYDKPKTINANLNPAAKIFIEVFNRIHKNLEPKTFPKSSKTIEKSYCTHSGLLAGKNCTSTKTGWYKVDALPKTCTSCTASSESENIIGEIIQGVIGGDAQTTAAADEYTDIIGEQ